MAMIVEVNRLEGDIIFWIIITIACVGIPFNISVLVVLIKFCGKLSPHLLLVCYQCMCDLLVLASNTYETSYKYADSSTSRYSNHCHRMACRTVSFYIINMSILNQISMGIDHFVALRLPLRYHAIVTKKRLKITLAVMTIMCVVACIVDISVGVAQKGYCTTTILLYFRYVYIPVSQVVLAVHIFLAFVVICCIYSYVFYIANKNRRHPMETNTKATLQKAMTSFYIMLTFLVCFVTYSTADLITLHHMDPTVQRWLGLTAVLPVLNCLCDPLIYAVRLQKIQAGYKDMWGRIKDKCGFCPSGEQHQQQGKNRAVEMSPRM